MPRNPKYLLLQKNINRYVDLTKKHKRDFTINYFTSLNYETLPAIQLEISRIEGLLQGLRVYGQSLASFASCGYVYRMQNDYEVMEEMYESDLVKIQAEIQRINYILSR